MDLVTVLADEEAIVDEATAALERAHLKHYAATGDDERRDRLRRLLELVTQSVRSRDLIPIVEHANRVATDRFHAGYEIGEVQTAFNVLEEVLWKRIVAGVPGDQLAEAIGLMSTVLGAGKDELARTYVSLASRQHVPSLDLSALFRGAPS